MKAAPKQTILFAIRTFSKVLFFKMSLILTQINKFGIVFVTDSNITVGNTSTEKGDKIFRIPKLNAALCLAGTYSVNGVRMDIWMKTYIGNDKSKTIKEFTQKLSKTLESGLNQTEKESGCIMHICGFVLDKDGEHPEMWGISNVDLLADGNYSMKKGFEYGEDFWNRDWTKNNLKTQFTTPGIYGYQYYINGFTSGRISFNALTQYLNHFLVNIWNEKKYSFRPPVDIREYERLARFTMGFIALMFNLSDYQPKLIGGRISSYCIEPKNKPWIS